MLEIFNTLILRSRFCCHKVLRAMLGNLIVLLYIISVGTVFILNFAGNENTMYYFIEICSIKLKKKFKQIQHIFIKLHT